MLDRTCAPSKVQGQGGGTGLEGQTLLLLGFLLSAWLFTIPPEFRRKNLCGEEDTIRRPDVCITPGQFASNVAEYYRNGGGIQWDFSVADSTKENLGRWAK